MRGSRVVSQKTQDFRRIAPSSGEGQCETVVGTFERNLGGYHSYTRAASSSDGRLPSRSLRLIAQLERKRL